MGSPAGPQIEKLAEGGANNLREVPNLPYTVKGNDVSYSGLLSAAKDLYSRGKSKEVVAFAVQEYAFSMLTEATERALAFTDKKELLVVGGVAANQRFARMLEDMCEPRGVKIGVVPIHYAGDCGSQIAVAGIRLFRNGVTTIPKQAFIRQSWRIDQCSSDLVGRDKKDGDDEAHRLAGRGGGKDLLCQMEWKDCN